MGLPLPETDLVHGWCRKDAKNISRAPATSLTRLRLNEWGLDAFRFYVLVNWTSDRRATGRTPVSRSRYQAELGTASAIS